MKKPLIILTGPTAVGKTKLSIALAKAVNGEIISADSMQVYRHMDIGSAKIKQEEMQGVSHYLIDVLAVSYTHLDVYKRQILERMGYVEVQEEEADFVIYNTCTVREDVYKRQFRFYEPGDEKEWAKLEYEIGDFDTMELAEEYFVTNYCQDINEIKRRCVFVLNQEKKIVGSCIAWHDLRNHQNVASLHWLCLLYTSRCV